MLPANPGRQRSTPPTLGEVVAVSIHLDALADFLTRTDRRGEAAVARVLARQLRELVERAARLP
jgi:hypothetical protein